MTEKGNAADPLQDLAPTLGNTPVAPAHAIAAIALSLALKYHDTITISDGAMYQQYKLEGRNMQESNLDVVFETALRMERYLLTASSRIAKIIVDAISVKVGDEDQQEQTSADKP